MLTVVGCDDETLGPQTRGTIEGVVQNAETNEPIARANVSTSPPTQSVLTDESGTFTLDVPTGNYSVQASKTDFNSRAVEVSVQADQTTSATILLEPEEDADAKSDSVTAQVTNWFNDRINRDSTGADSIFVDVEYSARNVGDVKVQRFDIFIEIDTAEGPFFEEVENDSLDTGQREVGRFRRQIPAEAQEVRVDEVNWETGSD